VLDVLALETWHTPVLYSMDRSVHAMPMAIPWIHVMAARSSLCTLCSSQEEINLVLDIAYVNVHCLCREICGKSGEKRP
jgi:hypothetical protein